MRRYLATLLVVGGIWPAGAAMLSTTNGSALRNFWLATERTNRPVTILSFGDSMADSYRSISFCMMNQFVADLGVAGYSMDNYHNTLKINMTNGTQYAGYPTPYWYGDSFLVPPGGGLWWETQDSPGGLFCDRAGVFYVSTPAGGAFTVSISTNGAVWMPVLTVSSYSDTPVGHFTNVDLSYGRYRLRVDGITGNSVIIGPQLVNSHTSGVHVAFNYLGGIGLDSVTNVPLAIRGPIFAALAPDLLIWHMKEDGSEATHQRLLENERWWSNWIPNCSVLYIGTPWAQVDLFSTATVDQNTIVRSVATAFHRAYVDCMNPAVSFDWMVTHGYMADATHENLQGNQYLEAFAWDDLGLFALGTPLQLSVAMVHGRLNVSFQTVTNLLYTLESSSDLLVWQPIVTIEGQGYPITLVPEKSGAGRSFRLRMQLAN
jgi:hypothetical protein